MGVTNGVHDWKVSKLGSQDVLQKIKASPSRSSDGQTATTQLLTQRGIDVQACHIFLEVSLLHLHLWQSAAQVQDIASSHGKHCSDKRCSSSYSSSPSYTCLVYSFSTNGPSQDHSDTSRHIATVKAASHAGGSSTGPHAQPGRQHLAPLRRGHRARAAATGAARAPGRRRARVCRSGCRRRRRAGRLEAGR